MKRERRMVWLDVLFSFLFGFPDLRRPPPLFSFHFLRRTAASKLRPGALLRRPGRIRRAATTSTGGRRAVLSSSKQPAAAAAVLSPAAAAAVSSSSAVAAATSVPAAAAAAAVCAAPSPAGPHDAADDDDDDDEAAASCLLLSDACVGCRRRSSPLADDLRRGHRGDRRGRLCRRGAQGVEGAAEH